MTRKIKKIEIESFRAYKEKEVFDMSISDEVANLVVLYAPNGSGKTSFFDAVEWAVSGEIKRISENNRVKEIADIEKGYILKNKYTEYLFGTVEINFSDREVIKMATKELKGNRKTDYTMGEELLITQEIKKLKEDNFIQKNLLTHDQVDKFLRFQNSRERYDALKVFWDFNEDTEIFKNLVIILQELESKEENINKEFNNIVKDLDKLRIEPYIMEKINNKISKLNKLSINKSTIELLANDENKVLEEFYHEFIKRKSIADNHLNNALYNKNSIQFLFENYNREYKENSDTLKLLELNLKKEIENKNKFELLLKKEEVKKKKII